MEDMDIDDYSRDRSRSPVRERSRSPGNKRESTSRDYSSKDSYSRRDYGNYRGRHDRHERGGRRGGFRGGRGDFGRRGGGYRGGRDFNSKRTYPTDDYSGGDEYRSKTERNYDNSIFIGNIPFDSSSKDIEAIFKNNFDVVRADIVTNRGQSRGMATVEFSNKEDVRRAISEFDHFEYRSREIFVRQDYPPPSDKKREFHPRSNERYERGGYQDRYERSTPREKPISPKPGTEIFVGNLPFSINWQALKDLMRKAGEVVRADVRTDRWGKSRGFGTVVFNTEKEAAEALRMFQDYEIEGRKLDTRAGRVHSQEKPASSEQVGEPALTTGSNSEFTKDVTGDGERSNVIFASNLPWVTVVDDLYELFETIGKVTKAEIQYNESGKPSGNAVIEFELEELADLAIENLNNYNYGGRDLKISYAKQGVDATPAPVEEGSSDIVQD